MNDMIHFELQNRKSGIFSEKFALFLPFYLHFCVTHRSNMQKQGTQILYQYLSTKVCLHSYNDTVSANTGVIIERCFRGFPPLEGVQILSSVPSLLCDALRCHPAWITSHGQYTSCSPKRYPTYHSRVSTWCFSKSYQVSI